MEGRGWRGLGFSRASVGVRPTHDQSQPKVELKNKFDALSDDGPAATRLGELGSLDKRSLGCRTPVPEDDFDEWEELRLRVEEFSQTDKGKKAMEEAYQRQEARRLAEEAKVPWLRRREVRRVPHSGGKHF